MDAKKGIVKYCVDCRSTWVEGGENADKDNKDAKGNFVIHSPNESWFNIGEVSDNQPCPNTKICVISGRLGEEAKEKELEARKKEEAKKKEEEAKEKVKKDAEEAKKKEDEAKKKEEAKKEPEKEVEKEKLISQRRP